MNKKAARKAYLVLVRHALSEDNVQRIVPGKGDPQLTELGKEQARQAGAVLRGIQFDAAYSSDTMRAKQTLEELLKTLGTDIPVTTSSALDERNWGDIAGKYSDNRESEYTQEEIDSWFTWDIRPPGGESYADIAKRLVGYFEREILPRLKKGEDILVVGHNGALKTIRRHLENIPYGDTHTLGMENAEVRVYEIGSEGQVLAHYKLFSPYDAGRRAANQKVGG